MGDRFLRQLIFYLHMHSHDIASANLNAKTAVGGIGAWKQVCTIILKFWNFKEILRKFLEIFREFWAIFRAFFKNFSKDI